jgi:hypothetical protein
MPAFLIRRDRVTQNNPIHRKTFFNKFNPFATAPNAVVKIRGLVLLRPLPGS